jgi:hypothetical protein
MKKEMGTIHERPRLGAIGPSYSVRGHWRDFNQAGIGLLVLAAAWVIPTAATRSESKPFLTMGEGSLSCGEFIRATEGEQKARPVNAQSGYTYTMRYRAFEAYADGFLTGSNMEGSANLTGQGTDHSGVMVWLESYCRQNPLANYVIALYWLRQFLINREE